MLRCRKRFRSSVCKASSAFRQKINAHSSKVCNFHPDLGDVMKQGDALENSNLAQEYEQVNLQAAGRRFRDGPCMASNGSPIVAKGKVDRLLDVAVSKAKRFVPVFRVTRVVL